MKIISEAYYDAICKTRGTFIQACISLEMVMDGYIAEHFCGTDEKGEELTSLILVPRITWGNKLEIFTVLIEKYNPSFMQSMKDFSKDIKNIIEHRNVFAHFPANTTKSGDEHFVNNSAIQFVRFKNSKLPVTKEIVYRNMPEYSEQNMLDLLTEIQNYTIAIRKMLR